MHTDAATPLSQVETDSFCDCGYNLHGQPVWRDERLGLLVCRCPECGRHAAAGRFTGIHSTWLHRVSLGLIITWILALLALLLFLTVMSGVFPGSYVTSYVTNTLVPNTGPGPTIYVYDLRELSEWDKKQAAFLATAMYSFAALTGLAIGAVGSICLWHLRRRVYLLLLLPVAAVAFVFVVWAQYDLTSAARVWLYGRLLSFVAPEGVAVLIGILAGRPVARFVLRLLLPDRLLQHLAFLWYRDGTLLPPMRLKEERGH